MNHNTLKKRYSKMTEHMETDESELVRPNSLFLHGVDNLSQKDIKDYLKRYVDDHFKIEWINDSSLNVVFEENDEAHRALNALTEDRQKKFDHLTERRSFQYNKSLPDVELTVRMSKIGDKKMKGAAQFSRYYLMNPDEEKKYRMAKYVTRSFRDREPIGRKSRILSDDEDDVDLFPMMADNAVISEETSTKQASENRSSEEVVLPEERKTSLKSNPLAERIGSLDDDDLFKR